MVKATDLGLPTENLQGVLYAKEDKKKREQAEIDSAIAALAQPERPTRLTPSLSPSLFGE